MLFYGLQWPSLEIKEINHEVERQASAFVGLMPGAALTVGFGISFCVSFAFLSPFLNELNYFYEKEMVT